MLKINRYGYSWKQKAHKVDWLKIRTNAIQKEKIKRELLGTIYIYIQLLCKMKKSKLNGWGIKKTTQHPYDQMNVFIYVYVYVCRNGIHLEYYQYISYQRP